MQERSEAERRVIWLCSMFLLGEGSEATAPYNKILCQRFQMNQFPKILAATALNDRNLNSVVLDQIFIFCCMIRHRFQIFKFHSKTLLSILVDHYELFRYRKEPDIKTDCKKYSSQKLELSKIQTLVNKRLKITLSAAIFHSIWHLSSEVGKTFTC